MGRTPIRRSLLKLLLAASVALAPSISRAQDSTAAPREDSEWQVLLLGAGYGAPNRWFLTLAAVEGGTYHIAGRSLMIEVGQAGTRVGAGYAIWAEGYGALARVTALRTYGRPVWSEPNRTLIGPEVRLAALASFGVAWLWDVGPRPRTGAPIVAYSLSFLL